MTCSECGEKLNSKNKDFTKPVIEINNPEALVLLRKVVISSSLGDETTIPPTVGKYHNVILQYESSGRVYFYSSDGIPTSIDAGIPQEVLDKITKLEDDLAEETTMREGIDEELQSNIDTVAQDLEDFKNSPDVVDIVATYAELQSYDTSKLGNNDEVRVLADETHSGASSYYRWDKGDSIWIFIGSVGPYYTKNETDALLEDKQNKLTAGENITITGNVISATGGGSSVNIVQSTGNSTTDVMSQKATTDMVYGDGDAKTNVRLGSGATAYNTGSISVGQKASSGSSGVAIGSNTTAYNTGVAIGQGADTSTRDSVVIVGKQVSTLLRASDNSVYLGSKVRSANTYPYSVALGNGATITRRGEVNISTGDDNTNGYDNTNYRILGGVHDPVEAQDAATKNYVDAKITTLEGDTPKITMTPTDPGEGSALGENEYIGVYGGDPIIMDYSTSEVNTGAKWIDGSAIYKKTISFGALPNATNKTVAHNITNVSRFVKVEQSVTNGGSGALELSSTSGSNTDAFNFYVTATEIGIKTSADRSNCDAYITLYYTKSS